MVKHLLLTSPQIGLCLLTLLGDGRYTSLTAVSALQYQLPKSTIRHSSNLLKRRTGLYVLVNPDQTAENDAGAATISNERDIQVDNQFVRPVIDGEMSSFVAKLEEKIGKVDDDRIIFPELESGEVSRMFSSLQYVQSDDGAMKSTHAEGSILGAAALVAGTVLGGGVLALPAATASVGLLPSFVGLCIGWFYTTISALIIAELSMNRLAQTGRLESGLLDLYEEYLGPNLSKVGLGAFYFMNYAVLTGYLAFGGQSLEAFLSSFGFNDLAMVPGIGQAVLAMTSAGAMYSMSPAVMEKVNSAFLALLAALLVIMTGAGLGTADFASMIDFANQDPTLLPNAFPIIFLTLMCQTVVPSVVRQLEGNRHKITASILAGTTVPALAIFAWMATVLGNVQGFSLTEGVDPLQLLQQADVSEANFQTLATVLSPLAVVTSLIAFSRETMTGLKHTLKVEKAGNDLLQSNAAITALCFVPPLALSIANPGIFDDALNYAGAFGLSTFFLVLPPIMAWGQRYGEKRAPLATKPIVPFGKLALGSMWKAAGTLIIEQGAERLGVFEWISENLLNK